MLSPVTPHRAICGSGPLSFPGGGPLQAFLPPEPFHLLVVHRPAFLPQQATGHPAAPADVLSRDLPEAMPELGLLNIDHLAGMALGAPVLPHHPADETLRSPVAPAGR